MRAILPLVVVVLCLFAPAARAISEDEVKLVMTTAQDTVDLVDQQVDHLPYPGCGLVCTAEAHVWTACEATEDVVGPLMCQELDDMIDLEQWFQIFPRLEFKP